MNPVIVRSGEQPNQLVGSTGSFQIFFDRKEEEGPRSIDLLLLGLGFCTYATVGHYLTRKNLPTDGMSVELQVEPAVDGNCYGRIIVMLNLNDAITDAQRTIIQNIAKSCRIHKTLESNPEIDIEIKP